MAEPINTIKFVIALQFIFVSVSIQQDNLALRKWTYQSNTYSGYDSSRSVDGNTETCSIASSGPWTSDFAFFQVDLADIYNIDRVIITNIRFEQESKYLSNFVIMVDSSNNIYPKTGSNVCASYTSNISLPMGASQSISCTQGPMRGRYVTVRRAGGLRPDSLALCELAVYAFVDPTTMFNLALNRPASQSRTLANYLASRATDGQLSTCTLAWADYGSSEIAYWQVDLGSVVQIDSVTIVNSNSAYESSFLTNFTVLVGQQSNVFYDGSNRPCFTYTLSYPVAPGRYFTFPCSASGRYLTIRRVGGQRQDALSLCEVFIPINMSTASTTMSTTLSTSLRITRSPLARGCYAYEYSCSGGRCVHRDWLCDGIRDCAYGDDESDANCGYCQSTEQRCRLGRQCFSRKSRCDGYANCQDASDESGCLTFETTVTNQDTRIVNAVWQDVGGYQFCSNNWDYNRNNDICIKMGYSYSYQMTYEKATTGKYLDSSNQPSNQCSNNYVIALKCQQYDCGKRSDKILNAGPYIINGDVALRGAWPWQISLFIDGNFWCGGSILNSYWILTAAHCVISGSSIVSASRMVVYAGSINLWDSDADKQRLYVSQVVVHPQNNNYYLKYDFALLRLVYPWTTTDTARSICLPSASSNVDAYKLCVNTGFGRPNYNQGSSNVLRQGRMNLMPLKDTCVNNLASMSSDISRNSFNQLIDYNIMICAGQTPTVNGVNLCHGDSGGPLACQDKMGRWVLIGVTSHYYMANIQPLGCLNSIYARVSAVVPWIQAYI